MPAVCAALALLSGCGKTLQTSATEQLLASNAVDRSVAQIDFTAMSGKKVYFDTKYLVAVKGIGFVNTQYITSALRQQLVAANCLLQESVSTADFVVEARVGALGIDHHEITYGIPSSNGLNSAASVVTSMPTVPVLPELSIAKKSDQSGAAKISVFAYNRESREPVWQSGVKEGRSSAKDIWIAGAGPFQSGTIYDHARFAGADVKVPFISDNDLHKAGYVDYFSGAEFDSTFVGPLPGGAESDAAADEAKDGEDSAEEAKSDKSTSSASKATATATATATAEASAQPKSEKSAMSGENPTQTANAASGEPTQGGSTKTAESASPSSKSAAATSSNRDAATQQGGSAGESPPPSRSRSTSASVQSVLTPASPFGSSASSSTFIGSETQPPAPAAMGDPFKLLWQPPIVLGQPRGGQR